MTAESKADIVSSRRITMIDRDDHVARATVVGSTGNSDDVERTPRGWSCSCECGMHSGAVARCSHALALSIVLSVPPCPPLPAWAHRRNPVTPDADLETCALFEQLADALDRRQAAHARRIAEEAFELGRQMTAYRLTRADVAARLERLIHQNDDVVADLIEVRLLPVAIGSAIAAEALARGLNAKECAA